MSIIQSKPYSIIFFGSFQHYSTHILKSLLNDPRYKIDAVITTPPRPSGRKQELKKTHTHQFCLKHSLEVVTPESLKKPLKLPPSDFLIVAGYGQKLPLSLLSLPKFMSLNFHPSLLPCYKGRFPIEHALLNQEKEIGISFIKMNQHFDQGEILYQQKLSVTSNDTKLSLYQKTYLLAAKILPDLLPKIAKGEIKPQPQKGKGSWAPQLTRKDGLISFNSFKSSLKNKQEKQKIWTKFRALDPWPGIWTKTPQGKRMKILGMKPNYIVQIEGKNPTPLNEIKNQLLS